VKQIKIAIDKFDFEDFQKEVIGFLAGQVSPDVHPSWAVVGIDAPGDEPEYGPEEGRSSFLDELNAGRYLFFPFSSSNACGPIDCADGECREYEDSEETEAIIGDVDCVGFLLKLKEGILYIDSAIHAGGSCPAPPPSVDISDCDIFEDGMKEFIRRFIRE